MPRKRKTQRRTAAQRRAKVAQVAEKLHGRQYRYGRRYSKRGHYYQQITDTHGNVVGSVRWHQQVRKEVAATVRALEGRPRRADVKVLGFRMPGWQLSMIDPQRGEPYFSRKVWTGAQPIGEPGGRTRGPRKGRTGKWLGRVFDVDLGGIDPREWLAILEEAARNIGDPRRAYVGVRAHGITKEGEKISTYQVPKIPLEVLRNDLLTWASTPVGVLAEAKAARNFLSSIVARLAQEYGYAGAVTLTSVDLTIYVLLEGLAHEPAVVPPVKVITERT